MARVYACLANGSTLDGVRLMSPQTIARVSAVQRDGRDAASQRPLALGLGYELQDALGTYAPAGPAFGHTGAGGSVHGCWPTLSTSFSFAMNLMRTEGRGTRARRLLAALHACVLAELRRFESPPECDLRDGQCLRPSVLTRVMISVARLSRRPSVSRLSRADRGRSSAPLLRNSHSAASRTSSSDPPSSASSLITAMTSVSQGCRPSAFCSLT
jgi:hypothetical protein